jgi:acyl transferase domain-containing protein
MTNAHLLDSSYDSALAIIGMAGRFSGAQDTAAFWQNIAGGVKSIRFFTDEELLAAGVSPDLLAQPNFVKAGSLLENVDRFDASFFGYTPREAELMDPQHRFFLECAWEAMEDAGYHTEQERGLVGIFAGASFSSYLIRNLYAHPGFLEKVGILQASIGSECDSLTSTVSYKLNLSGPCVTVQTFCSTSLVAVHMAAQSLLNYECDMALAGGVAIEVPHVGGYLYNEGGIVSPDGECRTFDADARGSVMGNGAGVVLLKRLRDALDDGDHIYAIIRGSAVNNDGSHRVSITAPGLDGQSEVIAEALGNAGIAAETIDYIEAHGTATELGDEVELAAMLKAFETQTRKKQFCAIGSVKPNIGHLDRVQARGSIWRKVLFMSIQSYKPGQKPIIHDELA